MKVLVAIKRVVDPYVKIRVKQDGSGVETDNVKMTINPFCEIAVEEAVRLKEANLVDSVTVVSIGVKACQEQLRTALALGADDAIHIDTTQRSNPTIEPLIVAKTLHSIAMNHGYDLVLLGKQSIDSDNNQVAQMLAALMQCAQATFASDIAFEGDKILVTREIDGGLETLKLSTPAVISTDLRLNEPRYASLPNIMKAKRKPLEVQTIESHGINVVQHQEIIEVMKPREREAGVMLGSVSELVAKLRDDHNVI
ncbi:electron transfer flavoprotein subunit beta/FixA family protein [Vibrio sp. 10N.261.55.A7]|uniref:electron transfer flavoprotein subunit beta/FixA family protein n=1 Tax=Vibrio sp. 10N.261.55.A7 TaxID=1880851 RepID=UPI000C82217D|nr:electron transfer flavoprotein subunit beta/FixA family protein [Vibrio sp. 10N.261.55.A7]PMJ99278.1 electron transporter RnfB [Vibrio sp. 10N.261.55.A7]